VRYPLWVKGTKLPGKKKRDSRGEPRAITLKGTGVHLKFCEERGESR